MAKISVIIPAYNAETTLRTAVESILSQQVPGMEIQPLISGYLACRAERFTREAACSFPAGSSPEGSPGRGCAYSSFKSCASLLVSPGWITKNQRSPKRLMHKRPMQNPFKKVFILLRPDPHRCHRQLSASCRYGAGRAKRRRTGPQTGQARRAEWASTAYRRSAVR